MSQDAGARRHLDFSLVAFQTIQAQNKRCVSVRIVDWFDLRAAIY